MIAAIKKYRFSLERGTNESGRIDARVYVECALRSFDLRPDPRSGFNPGFLTTRPICEREQGDFASITRRIIRINIYTLTRLKCQTSSHPHNKNSAHTKQRKGSENLSAVATLLCSYFLSRLRGENKAA